MKHSLDIYADFGRKAALAGNRKDDVLEQIYAIRASQAISTEQGLERKQAELFYQETYASYRQLG